MSDILENVHKTAKDLRRNNAIGKMTMHQFDALCLTDTHSFSPDDVKQLRERFHLSQPVFAEYLNVSSKVVKKWEQGESSPRGAALKLLVLAEKNGIDAIA